jgi:hypothetical protein
MRPLHPADQLRLAEDRRCAVAAGWPRALHLRQRVAYALLRLAIRLDPPHRRTRPTMGAATTRR